MKTKFSPILSTFKSALVASSLIASIATAAVTAPVGYVKLTFNKEADTPFSIPMNRAKVFSGKIDSHSGNSITINSNAFTASQFVYNDGSQNDHFYILFTSGTLEGRSFDIQSNTLNSVTVTQASVDSTGTNDLAALINNASSTDSFEIRPHWTLNTLFPNGEGFPAVTNKFDNNSSQIYLVPGPNDNFSGENFTATKVFKYVTNEGWYDSNMLFAGTFNNTVLRRDTYFVFNNTTSNIYTKNITGDVPTTKLALLTKSKVIKQDNAIAFNFPVNLTLANTGLATSSTFVKATNRFANNGDILQVFPENPTNYNTLPSKGYFYVQGEGWYDNTDLTTTVPESTLLNTLGGGFRIRKAAGVEESKQTTPVTRPYDPFTE